MIYLDTSVALAWIFGETRRPPDDFWASDIVSSRLLQYEMWTRVHARGLGKSHGERVRGLLERLSLLELGPPVLDRALDPMPLPVRTLDALHLASMEFLRTQGQAVQLASYDAQLSKAARALKFEVLALD